MDTLPPSEDINTIVSRFHAWADSQATSKPKDGVRELTYEEAISARRSRSAASEIPPVKQEKNDAPALPIALEPAAKAKKLTKQSASAVKLQRKVNKTIGRDGKPAMSVAKPAFRQVLAQSAALIPATGSSSTGMVHRPVALSVRVSENEQALIKARAIEANLSVSSYLRHCALEVEHLRARTEWERAPEPPVSTPPRALPRTAASFAPGFLARMIHRVLGRSTTLAVQA